MTQEPTAIEPQPETPAVVSPQQTTVNRFYTSFDTAHASGREGFEDDHRSPFQVDRDRILHSAALRRLQGKTQVFHSFLIGEYDFYRTRLTHSLEVAQIGRSICDWLAKNSPLLSQDFFIDADLVEAACLAHDLGHPPFGHTGEKVLHDLMQPYGGFEGNAQTLRLLTTTLFSEKKRGMDPTRALQDAVLKYKTLLAEDSDAKNHYLYDIQAADLTFVFNSSPFPENMIAGKVRNDFRSLECQIMDWADDTAYSINDLADAIQTGIITVAKLERWGEENELAPAQAEHLQFLIKAVSENRVESRLGRNIGDNIRACSLQVRANFMSPLTNRYRYELVIDAEVRAKVKVNKKVAVDLVFNTQQLHQHDFKVETVIKNLFEVMEKRYIKRDGHQRLQLLPTEVAQPIEAEPNTRKRARLVCDWLSSLTDRTALRIHQRLFDIQTNADLV